MTREEILAVAKPILFNTEMTRAIMDGRKTATRRVIKPQPCDGNGTIRFKRWFYQDYYTTLARFGDDTSAALCDRKSACQPGDLLYVRETWYKNYPHQYGRYFYHADGEEIQMPLITGGTAPHGKADGLKWHPSIHMPREAARLFLRVKEVRVERLQDIDDSGVVAEGLNIGDPFDNLWDSTIKKADLPLYGWDANPWVWVIAFERMEAQ